MKQVKNISLAMLAGLLMASCSNEDDPVTPTDDSKVELGITAGVALTKSVIDGGDQKDATGGNLMGALAVYAKDKSSTSSYESGNNYALYTRSDATWNATEVSGKTPKIYLTSDVATIYAYHPAYTPDGTNHNMQTTGTPLEITGTLGTDAKIAVSVFEGGTSPTSSLNTNSTITVPDGYDATSPTVKILSAPGEVDYMWANGENAYEANNGKGTGAPGSSVALNMKHALSMVSFRVYNDGHYNKEGKLSKIVLENTENAVLSKGTDPTMDIATGVITAGNAVTATYKRIIANHNDADGYTLPKQGASGFDGSAAAAKDAAAVFSILVLPDASAVAKNNIQVTFTIDGESFNVKLAADGTGVQWAPGKNNIYTAKLSGQSLTLTSVKVEEWGKEDNKNLEVK